ncbi:MAG: hypothetical protein JW915_04505 [Chitinispirillaceae bacterium]|nr:hypothetical protein [Chitinispirillaceae bacterium]
MDIVTFINCCFGWFLVLLAIIGYFLTYKRIGEKWAFWNVLAAGWAFFALAQTLLLAGVQPGTVYLIAIWLSSFIVVIASMVMMFIKMTAMKIKT